MKRTIPILMICHGRPTLRTAVRFGWLPGARYTNLRDVRGFERIGLIDIDWKKYDFHRHLEAVSMTRPLATVAKDVESMEELPKILQQAKELEKFVEFVIIVPKDPRLADGLHRRIPERFVLGYSVPTKHGGTTIPLHAFRNRPVHLLGGRPDTQLALAKRLNVISVDVNRFTLDASFGDYFDGERFRPHPVGGYRRCIRDSISNITECWQRASDG